MSHLTGDIVGFFKGQPVPTSVRYFPEADPYAMVFIFFTPEPVQWTFARDLLVEGLTVPAGEGDVKFRPHEGHIIMEITDPTNNGSAEFVFLRQDIQSICEIAETMMPQGNESEKINWDAELAGLLEEPEPDS